MFFDFPQNNDFQVSTVSQIFKNIYIHENKHFLGATQPKKTALNKQKNTHTPVFLLCEKTLHVYSVVPWLVGSSIESLGIRNDGSGAMELPRKTIQKSDRSSEATGLAASDFPSLGEGV